MIFIVEWRALVIQESGPVVSLDFDAPVLDIFHVRPVDTMKQELLSGGS